MRIVGDEIRYNETITIIQLLLMTSKGTTVHIKINDSETVYIHTVETAKGVISFCQHLYGEVKHLLRVYEITIFTSENGNGLEVYCV